MRCVPHRDWPEAIRLLWKHRRAEAIASSSIPRARQELGRLLAFMLPQGEPFVGFSVEEVQEYLEIYRPELSRRQKPRSIYDSVRHLRMALEAVDPGTHWLFLAAEAARVRRALSPESGQPRGPTRSYCYTASLQFDDWPPEEKKLWKLALVEAAGGRGVRFGKLAPRYLDALKNAYGRWILFLRDRNLAAVGPSKETIELYLDETVRGNRLSTVYQANLVRRLWRVLFAFDEVRALAGRPEDEFAGLCLDPHRDTGVGVDDFAGLQLTWEEQEESDFEDLSFRSTALGSVGEPLLDWLLKVALVFGRQAKPRDKSGKIVPLPRLVELGLSLCEEAVAMRLGVPAAVKYRDGLMIALLALRCLRFKNLIGLRISRGEGCREGYDPVTGVISIAASQVKNRERYEAGAPRCLAEHLLAYIEVYRPLLLGCAENDALWISREGGRPLSASQARNKIVQLTTRYLGVGVSPHLFRDSNAHFLVEQRPGDFWAILGVLGHRDARSSETYRRKASSAAAAIESQRVLLARAGLRPSDVKL